MWKVLSGIAAVMLEGGAFMLLPSQPKVAWALILIGILLFIWMYILYRRENKEKQEGGITHEYFNCIVHQYPDGTAKAEPKPVEAINKPVPTETSVSLAIPTLEILASNNVLSIDDNGVGDYTINFDNPISGEYTVNVSSDENVEYKVEEKYADCASIKFTNEKPNTLKIEFKKIRD